MRVAGQTDADRAWASLSEEEQRAIVRGEGLPSARRDGPVVRASIEADRVFEEVRREGGRLPVERIRSGRNFGWTDAAVAELVDRGLLRRVAVTDRVRHGLAAIGTPGESVDVEVVEVVPGYERALLVPPVSGRPRSAA